MTHEMISRWPVSSRKHTTDQLMSTWFATAREWIVNEVSPSKRGKGETFCKLSDQLLADIGISRQEAQDLDRRRAGADVYYLSFNASRKEPNRKR